MVGQNIKKQRGVSFSYWWFQSIQFAELYLQFFPSSLYITLLNITI